MMYNKKRHTLKYFIVGGSIILVLTMVGVFVYFLALRSNILKSEERIVLTAARDEFVARCLASATDDSECKNATLDAEAVELEGYPGWIVRGSTHDGIFKADMYAKVDNGHVRIYGFERIE